jgi:hypothetical protein
MAAPATLARERVTDIIETEFSAEGWSVEADRLLHANGREGADRIACYPESENEGENVVLMLKVNLRVQIYLAYEDNIDENQAVDPTLIEGYADRLRRAFGDNSSGSADDMWWVRLTNVEYPPDPTGNISRLEALVIAQCDNPASLTQ